MNLSVHILVLNYNGRELLEKYLPSLEKAAAQSRFSCRLGVVDNQSSDGSLECLRSRFPKVDLYLAKENRVLCSYNEAALHFEEEILIFMNNG